MFVHGRHLVLVAVVAASIALTHGERVGLYEDSDLMEILDSTNFNEKVVQGNTSYVIEFYNAFCGHCIRFAVPWKEFGLQVYGNQSFFVTNSRYNILILILYCSAQYLVGNIDTYLYINIPLIV